MVTIREIARKCGVSTATVSLVLSNNPRISDKTKKKVLKVVRELNYYPNLAAKTLSTNKTHTLCVVVPQISQIFLNPFFAEALSGIYDYASKNGYRIILEVATYEFCFYKKYLSLFKERVIDGMLYVGSTLRDTYLVDLIKENLPIILVGSYFPESKRLPLSYVIGDNVQGGYLATKHLLELGHRRIGFITGHFGIISAYDRYIGYKKALQEAGIKIDKLLIAKADFDEETGYKAMKKLLNNNKDITAVFAGNDMMALGTIRAIKEYGLKVPQDISVVGMDNCKTLRLEQVGLTTVDYNVYKIGEVACKKLIEMISSEKSEVSQIKEVLPVKLIVRETTCQVQNVNRDTTEQMFGTETKLTEKQRKVLEFINKSIKNRGFPPTIREICKYFKFRSVSSAHQVVQTLYRKGCIKFRISDLTDRRVARGMKLTTEQMFGTDIEI
ncbi:MAG: substrate-binding domain-containing protein [Endomicrobia bacterium]|nr:substrate-binding domain-containing protein [Endomicrobiia bacterium]